MKITVPSGADRGLGACVLLLGLATLLVVSCEAPEGAGAEDRAPEAAEIAETGDDDEIGSSCLQEFEDEERTCDLVSLETMQSIFPEAKEIEVTSLNDVPEAVRSSFKGTCAYAWDTGRMTTTKLELPTGDVLEGEREIGAQVRISGISQTSLDTFRRAYRTPTAEEKAEIEARMAEELERTPGAEDLTEEEKEIGEGIVESAMADFEFEAVEGLGRAAAWGKVGSQTLVVLHEDTKFEISVHQAYEEKERNRQAAIEMARAVLANCD